MDDVLTPTVSRRTLLAALAALPVAGLTLAACGSSDNGIAPPGTVRAEGVARLAPPSDAPVAAAAAGMMAFAHGLAGATATSGNWIASPLSIATAFAMARAGANGATAAALDKAFGYPATGRDEAFNAITRSLVTTDTAPAPAPKPSPGAPPLPPVVALGNALFTAATLHPNDAYLRILAQQYGAGLRTVDFSSPQAAQAINGWADKQTAGRIKQLVGNLSSDTTLVIANTVYLRASWLSPFKDPAYPATFHAPSGTVQAPTMSTIMGARYAASAGWRALEMPYAAGNVGGASGLAMWILLPPDGTDPLTMLAPATVGAVGAALAKARLSVSVPKWNVTTNINLVPAMKQLGVTDVFDDADFSGIASGLGSINGAVHSANITVTEDGTEAAAATAIEAAAGAEAPPPLSFTADRPFAYVIVGGDAHVPLFAGIVRDPTR